MGIPFEEINRAALAQLPSLLAEWLPAGKRIGHEYVVGNLAGEPGESVSINLRTCKGGDFAGDVRFGDPIGLYAQIFTHGERVTAARQLGTMLGVYMNGSAMDPPGHLAPRIANPIAEKEPELETEYRSCEPPDDAPPAPTNRATKVHAYRNERGKIVSYVLRIEKNGEKTFRGLSWDGKGWRFKHPTKPRMLYGLDELAVRPDATVMICEGEKAADAASLLWPHLVCVSWPGGTGAIAYADWTPLLHREVIIFPDNDEPGHKAARQILSILSHAFVLDVSDLPPKADAADIKPDDPEGWLRDRLPPEPENDAQYEESPAGDHEPHDPDYTDYPEHAPHAEPEAVKPLGYDRGIYYYYSTATRQVTALKPAEHTRAGLCGIASEARYWALLEQFKNKHGQLNWNALADWLMTQCRDIGIYDPNRIRGRGAWLEGKQSLLHTGDALIIDGKPHPLNLPGSDHIYEAAPTLALAGAQPLANAEAHWLIKICDLLRWERRVSSRLLAGWIAVAPICGALVWRPSIWIAGGAGSGKSWLRENVIGRCLGDFALAVQSKTSEAGLRQSLGSDARPVIFDEAEREDAASAARMQAVLDLVRQSSSEGGAEIVKGTATQSGVKRYRIRSCFAFQSINVALLHQADESRITVLGLRDASSKSSADEVAFADLELTVRERLTPEFRDGLIARSVSLIPQIRANAETFARAIAAGLGNRRMGDQLGTLLAGAYSLHSTGLITPEAAAEYVSRSEWLEDVPQDDDKDEYRLLRHILASKMRAGTVDYTVSRLIEAAASTSYEDGLLDAALAKRTLSESGIKYGERERTPGIYISTNHPAIRAALRGTPWDASWSRALARLPNTESGRHVIQRFALGHVTKATFIPMSTIDPEEPA